MFCELNSDIASPYFFISLDISVFYLSIRSNLAKITLRADTSAALLVILARIVVLLYKSKL